MKYFKFLVPLCALTIKLHSYDYETACPNLFPDYQVMICEGSLSRSTSSYFIFVFIPTFVCSILAEINLLL